jgi:hypothetical protein
MHCAGGGDFDGKFLKLKCAKLTVCVKNGGSDVASQYDNCNFINEWVSQNGLEKGGIAEGFADDLTLLFKFTNVVMEMIIDVMAEFRLCSGLELNKTKTQLMVVGTNGVRVGDMISGIAMVGRVKILGLSIDRNLSELRKNWDITLRKITKLSNFWKLQKLSIVGRILVSKTFLMSQATFLLGVLPLEKEVGDRINALMANFIKGNDWVIAKDRWCIARELGGYGMVDLHVMNTCIKANSNSEFFISLKTFLSNVLISQKIIFSSILNTITRLKKIGHVSKLKSHRIPKSVFRFWHLRAPKKFFC